MDRAMEARYQAEPGVMQNHVTKAGEPWAVDYDFVINHFAGHLTSVMVLHADPLEAQYVASSTYHQNPFEDGHS